MDTDITTERLERVRKDIAEAHGVQPNQIWIRKAWIELNSYGETVLKTSFDVVGPKHSRLWAALVCIMPRCG